MDFHDDALLAGGSHSAVKPAPASSGSLPFTRSHHACSQPAILGQSQ